MKKQLLVLVTIAILCVVVLRVGFMFTTTGEENPAEIERAKRLAIAIERDTPPVAIRGTALLPDGSPANYYHIGYQSVAFVLSQSFSSSMDSAGLHRHGTSTRVNREDGTFHFSAQPGANVVITFSPVTFTDGRENPNRRFVTKPIVIAPYENMEPLHITLEEGIPVRGSILYCNSTPAAERSLYFEQQVEPIIGADILDMRNALRVASSRYVTSNNAGEYEIFLLPGEYTIFHRHGDETHREILTIDIGDTEKRFDWTLPTPIFVETFSQEELVNTSPRLTGHAIARENGIHSVSGRIDSFILEPVTVDSTLFIADYDNKLGTIETITPAMVGETVRFELKPMGNVTITLVDANNEPVVGKSVSLSIHVRVSEMSTSSMRLIGSTAVTDSDGKAVIHVPPGRTPSLLTLPGSSVSSIFGGGRAYQRTIERVIDLAPGETYDFGTIRLTNVFDDCGWQSIHAPAMVCCPK